MLLFDLIAGTAGACHSVPWGMPHIHPTTEGTEVNPWQEHIQQGMERVLSKKKAGPFLCNLVQSEK